jgi:hypothetical protein
MRYLDQPILVKAEFAVKPNVYQSLQVYCCARGPHASNRVRDWHCNEDDFLCRNVNGADYQPFCEFSLSAGAE